MSRDRPRGPSKRAQPGSALKIDLPALVVMALTAFFATLFATLLLLRPEASDPAEPIPADSPSTQSAPQVNTPPVDAPPVSTAPPSTSN